MVKSREETRVELRELVKDDIATMVGVMVFIFKDNDKLCGKLCEYGPITEPNEICSLGFAARNDPPLWKKGTPRLKDGATGRYIRTEYCLCSGYTV